MVWRIVKNETNQELVSLCEEVEGLKRRVKQLECEHYDIEFLNNEWYGLWRVERKSCKVCGKVLKHYPAGVKNDFSKDKAAHLRAEANRIDPLTEQSMP
jgi:hypothetical protein